MSAGRRFTDGLGPPGKGLPALGADWGCPSRICAARAWYRRVFVRPEVMSSGPYCSGGAPGSLKRPGRIRGGVLKSALGLAEHVEELLGRLGLAGTEWACVRADTIRLRLLKVAARVRITARRVVYHLSSSCPYELKFREVMDRLCDTS